MQYFAAYFLAGLAFSLTCFLVDQSWTQWETPDFQLGVTFLFFITFWPLVLLANVIALIGKTLKKLVKN